MLQVLGLVAHLFFPDRPLPQLHHCIQQPVASSQLAFGHDEIPTVRSEFLLRFNWARTARKGMAVV